MTLRPLQPVSGRQAALPPALCACLAVNASQALEIRAPKSAAEVNVPSSQVLMQPEYDKTSARFAYVWGWPMVNMRNRRAPITQTPEPGRLNGVLPVAPRELTGMLSDYIDLGQTFVTCPSQDVAYGLGFFSLHEEPAVAQVPDFGDRFWCYAMYDGRTDQFAEIGKPYGTKPGFYLIARSNWQDDVSEPITGVVRVPTALANAIPRVFMDETPVDREAIQPVIDQSAKTSRP